MTHLFEWIVISFEKKIALFEEMSCLNRANYYWMNHLDFTEMFHLNVVFFFLEETLFSWSDLLFILFQGSIIFVWMKR